MSLYNLFLNAQHKFRDNIAIIDPRKNISITFSGIIDHFNRTGDFLGQQNIAPSSRVAILADADSEALLLDYALMATGRIKVPLDNALSVQEIRAQIQDSCATVLFFAEKYREIALELQQSGFRCIAISQLSSSQPAGCYVPEIPQQQILSLNYTGGSTGNPKAVMHTHGSLVSIMSNMIIARNIQPGDKFLNVRPLWPVASVVVLAHILAGGTVILEQRFSAATFLSLLRKHQAAYSSLVPTQLSRLLEQLADEPLSDVPYLKCIDIGASAIPADVLDKALHIFDHRLAILYGMTEAPWSSYLRYRELPPEYLSSDRGLSGMIGHPVFAASIKIHRPDQNGVGEIMINGAHLMSGYWQNNILTGEVLQDRWLKTGDLGQDAGYGYFRIVGRLKEVIRSGGKSILPAEVETCILSYPGISEVHVFGRQDNEWGEKICAAIVLSDTSVRVNIQQLTLFCKSALSHFKVPKEFYILDSLPRSHYGKIKSKEVIAKIERL